MPGLLVAPYELDPEPEDPVGGDVPDERLAGRQVLAAGPEPQHGESGELESDFVGEGRVQAHTGRHTQSSGTVGIEGDAPPCSGGSAWGLGEQTPHPAHGHPQRHRGGEQVTRAGTVTHQALGDVDAEPGAEKPAQDGAIAVEPMLDQRRVVRHPRMLQPRPQSHEGRATDECPGHHEEHPLIGGAAPARLDDEHHCGTENPKGDKQRVECIGPHIRHYCHGGFTAEVPRTGPPRR